MERKVFTELKDKNAEGLHESMAKIGFRRSQDIAYRPSCEDCSQCKSVRVPVNDFRPNKTQKRLIKINSDIITRKKDNIATEEHYELLSAYLANRHSDGGMANMTFDEYVNMVEMSTINTCLFEYRLPSINNKIGKLIGLTLTDIMTDSISMVYSFYDVGDECKKRSLGTYIILDHIAWARLSELNHVYLGYWVENSAKMSYKKNFHPLEILEPDGWFLRKNL